VPLGLEVFDSEVAVAVLIDALDDDDIAVEDGEGVVVGRMRIEVGTALLIDSVTDGDPDAVKMDVALLELVVVTELVSLIDVVGSVVEVDEVVSAGGSLMLEVLEPAALVTGGVLTEPVSKIPAELSCAVVSNVEESVPLMVEGVNMDDVETLLGVVAATTCDPVSEALAATPGVMA
jgi:hypothetical protein